MLEWQREKVTTTIKYQHHDLQNPSMVLNVKRVWQYSNIRHWFSIPILTWCGCVFIHPLLPNRPLVCVLQLDFDLIFWTLSTKIVLGYSYKIQGIFMQLVHILILTKLWLFKIDQICTFTLASSVPQKLFWRDHNNIFLNIHLYVIPLFQNV